MLTDVQLAHIHTKCDMHMPELVNYLYVSCFHCERVYHRRKITETTDDGMTAMCPKCGIDAVLPGKYPPKVLAQMKAKYFGTE